MPLPNGVTTFTLTGDELDATGAAAIAGTRGTLVPVDASGKPVTIVHLATGVEIVPAGVTFTIATDGTWSVGPLPYTDQPGLSVVGFQYKVTWNVPVWRASPGDKTFSVPSGTASPVLYSTVTASPTVPTVLVPIGTGPAGPTGAPGPTGPQGPAAPDATTTTKGLVQLAGDLGGTAAAPTVPGLAAKTTAGQAVFGTDPSTGAVNQPWKPQPALTSNLATGVTLPATATSTLTAQTIRLARVDLLANGRVSLPSAVRVLFTASLPDGSGVCSIVISQRTSNGSSQTGGDTPILSVGGLLNYESQEQVVLLNNTRYADINAVFGNNYTGTVTLSELDVRLVTNSGPRIKTGTTTTAADTATTSGGGQLMVDVPGPGLDGNLYRLRVLFGQDGAQEIALAGASIFRDSRYPTPWPGAATGGSSQTNLDPNGTKITGTALHITNNDLVMNTQLANTPGSFEVRGNTHGGESGASGIFHQDYIYEYDRGDGTWIRMTGGGQQVQAYRVRVTMHTKVVHSDSSTPFANIDRVYTIFNDGVVRTDRTVTFLTATTVEKFFYIMNSIDPATMNFLGRIGRARQVLRDLNTQTPARNGGGVSLSAATIVGATTVNLAATPQMINPQWVGSIILIGSGGTAEVRRVTAATNSSFTLDTALSNAHSIGEVIVQLDEPTTTTAASAAGATTLTLTDTVPRNAVLVVDSGNRREARRVTGITTTGSPYTVTLSFALDYAHASGVRVYPVIPGDDLQSDGRAEWAAYLEPCMSGAFGQVFDRAAIQAHNLGGTLTTDLIRNTATNYVAKLYTYLALPVPIALAAGTVISDIYYWRYYVPRDLAQFHAEIADLGSATSAERAAMYPAT